jgi:hypothetical protein
MAARHLLEAGDPSPGAVVKPDAFGSPIERRRWWRTSVYGRAPRFVRSFAYFVYRFIFRGGFIDGTPGFIYHFLHGCWFRFYVNVYLYELQQRRSRSAGSSAVVQ